MLFTLGLNFSDYRSVFMDAPSPDSWHSPSLETEHRFQSSITKNFLSDLKHIQGIEYVKGIDAQSPSEVVRSQEKSNEARNPQSI